MLASYKAKAEHIVFLVELLSAYNSNSFQLQEVYEDLTKDSAHRILRLFYEAKINPNIHLLNKLISLKPEPFSDRGFFANSIIVNTPILTSADQEQVPVFLKNLNSAGFLVNKKSIDRLSKRYSFHEIAGILDKP